MKQPFTLIKRTREADGQGGYTETDGETSTVWGHWRDHDGQLRIDGVDSNEDTEVGDEIEIRA